MLLQHCAEATQFVRVARFGTGVEVVSQVLKVLHTSAGQVFFRVNPVADTHVSQLPLNLRGIPMTVLPFLIAIGITLGETGKLGLRFPFFERNAVLAYHEKVWEMLDVADFAGCGIGQG